MSKKDKQPFYRKMKKAYPEVIAALDTLGSAAKQAGPLDEKTVQLIQLAAAAAIRAEGSVQSHARRALEAGAKPEEVRHALLALVNIVGFPGVIAATNSADEVLEARRKKK